MSASPPARHQLFRLQRAQALERLRPVLKVRVTRIGCRAELHQVAGVQDFLVRQPGNGVALRVAASGIPDFDALIAQVHGQLAVKHDIGPRQPLDAFVPLEQPREAAKLAFPVLLASFHDQLMGTLAGDDVFRPIGRRTQHTHRVVMGEHDVPDGLVGHRANFIDDLLGHLWRRLGVEYHDGVVADDHAGVGVTLGREGIGRLGPTRRK